MKTHQLYIKILLTILLSNLQPLMAQVSQNNLNDKNLYGILYISNYPYRGTPYLFDSWSLGVIKLTNEEEISNVKLKYNSLSNELIFFSEELQNQFSVDPYTCNEFMLINESNDSLFFSKYQGENIFIWLKTGDFVQILHRGKVQLWAKYSSTIIKSNNMNNEDELANHVFYFLQFDDKIEKLSLNKKSIIRIFPQQRNKINELARKVHFRKNQKESMIRLLSELDKLLDI